MVLCEARLTMKPLALSDSSNNKNGLRAIQRLRLNAERFCLAAKICSMIVAGLIQTTFCRWAALAKILYMNFKDCIQLFKKIQVLENELTTLAVH